MNYALCVAYDGTRYHGWQRLPGQDTVQGRLENVLSKIFECPIEISGSGRTDKGVHARAQWASFKQPAVVEPKALLERINAFLPSDIRILSVKHAQEDFHPRYSALYKVYSYRIETGPVLSPFDVRYCDYLGQKPDLKAMESAKKCMTGTMDFAALSQAKSKKKSTIRTVQSIDFKMVGSILEISVQADGFLYNMMRRIVTACLEVGLGRLSVEALKEALEKGNRGILTYQVPPQGLFLKEVHYVNAWLNEG